jgi:hypothetical protein
MEGFRLVYAFRKHHGVRIMRCCLDYALAVSRRDPTLEQ